MKPNEWMEGWMDGGMDGQTYGYGMVISKNAPPNYD